MELFQTFARKSTSCACVFVCLIFQEKNIVFEPFQPLSMTLEGVLYQEKNMRAGSISEMRNPGQF
jgi:hypothetical protein